MLPLLLSATLIVFWALIGRAILAALRCRFGLLRSWLLSPAIGFSALVLLMAFLNQRGLPIDAFAWPLAAALLLAVGVVFIWCRPLVPARALLPYGLVTVAFLAIAGAPAFKVGFNWVSYVNDDFTNYCLSAERFRQFGFFHAPTLTDLAGRDYSQYYFFMHTLDLMRFGSEHTLAFVAALTGLNSLRIFMPVILAMAVMQILSASALVLHRGRYRWLALLTAILLAASPLFIFGSLYQLIAQVGGLGLMLAVLALLTARTGSRGRLGLLARAVPTAMVGAGLALTYPECSPFAVLAYVIFLALAGLACFGFAFRRKRDDASRGQGLQQQDQSFVRASIGTIQSAIAGRFGAYLVLLEYTLILWAIFLRFNLVSYLYTLAIQFTSGFHQADLSLSLFPFFLIPSGLSSLFGFQQENQQLANLPGSILILLGLILLIAITIYAVRRSLRATPVAVLLLVELLVGARLFQSGSDFGLYKLAMYVQPALMAGLAAVILGLSRRRAGVAVIMTAAVLALTARTSYAYIDASLGSHPNSYNEMRFASQDLARRPPPAPGARWDSGIDNVVAGKLAANFYRGTDLHFLARDFFHNSEVLLRPNWPLMRAYPHPELYQLGLTLWGERNHDLFYGGALFGSQFYGQASLRPPADYLELPADLSLFNKFNQNPADDRQLLDLLPANSVQNRLVFVHSALGNHYYLGDRKLISFFQQENDTYRPGKPFNGIGRFFLFRVEHPTGPVYLRIAATKTTMGGDNKHWSSAAVVKGREELPLHLLGSGAANRIVGPIDLVPYRDGAYLALDLGQEPKPFPIVRRGIEALYHSNVPLDYRRLVAYGRDISLLSAAQYADLHRPLKLTRFPDDLAGATSLEFSGIYEDGWISPDADFVFGSIDPHEAVHLTGFVPHVPWAPDLTGKLEVYLNGRLAAEVPATIGAFDWLIPVAHPAKDIRLRLHFTAFTTFPAPDGREVAAKIQSIEIIPQPSKFSFSSAGMRSPSTGIDTDGWAGPVADLWTMAPAPNSHLILKLEYPGWPGVPPSNELEIQCDSGRPISVVLKPGITQIPLIPPQDSSVFRLQIRAKTVLKLPKPDTRERAFRLLSIETVANPSKIRL